jgi:hypothetical protein
MDDNISSVLRAAIKRQETRFGQCSSKQDFSLSRRTSGIQERGHTCLVGSSQRAPMNCQFFITTLVTWENLWSYRFQELCFDF